MDNNRSISEKYALDYYRQSLPTRAWKLPWNYLALLLALLAVVVMYFVRRNTLFEAAPVASVHLSFGTDCAKCHDQSWGAGQRLVAASNQPHSVSNDACQKCHQAAKHAEIPLVEPMCAECHQEHRPGKSLTALANSACIRCHSDLPAFAKDVAVFPRISRFEAGEGGHPNFALKRTNQENVGARHAVRRVAEYKPSGNGEGEWVDRGGLHFTHRAHLNPELLDPNRKPAKLDCSNCHVRSDDGYMQPVKYEQHCSRCHPLRLVAPFADLLNRPLPHRPVEEVRGVIRLRLANQLAKSSAKQKDVPSDTQFKRLPKPVRLSADQERDLSIKAEQVEKVIFGSEFKGTCSRCHDFKQRDGDWYVQPEDVEMVPSRWMFYATFNHKTHRTVNCNSCHPAKNSNKTSEVLMPSIAVCQECHGTGAKNSSTHVSADCVLCHTYHMESAAKDFRGLPLEQLLSNGSSKPTGDARR